MNKSGLSAVPVSCSDRPTVAVVFLVGVLGFAQACTTWRTVSLTPKSFPRRDSLRVVRVTRADGTRLQLQYAEITPDSLRGIEIRAGTPSIVPLSDVTRVQTHHFDAGKTIGLLLGLGLAAGAAILIAVAQSFGSY
jgi:hypothetical protein